eukprot:2059520-Amphidinium_carterae.1
MYGRFCPLGGIVWYHLGAVAEQPARAKAALAALVGSLLDCLRVSVVIALLSLSSENATTKHKHKKFVLDWD